MANTGRSSFRSCRASETDFWSATTPSAPYLQGWASGAPRANGAWTKCMACHKVMTWSHSQVHWGGHLGQNRHRGRQVQPTSSHISVTTPTLHASTDEWGTGCGTGWSASQLRMWPPCLQNLIGKIGQNGSALNPASLFSCLSQPVSIHLPKLCVLAHFINIWTRVKLRILIFILIYLPQSESVHGYFHLPSWGSER